MDYIENTSIQRMVLIENATMISYSGIGKRAAHRVLGWACKLVSEGG